MQRIKFFKGVENELSTLEGEINVWIESEGAKIISVTGNIAPQTSGTQLDASFASSDVLVIVVYETSRG